MFFGEPQTNAAFVRERERVLQANDSAPIASIDTNIGDMVFKVNFKILTLMPVSGLDERIALGIRSGQVSREYDEKCSPPTQCHVVENLSTA